MTIAPDRADTVDIVKMTRAGDGLPAYGDIVAADRVRPLADSPLAPSPAQSSGRLLPRPDQYRSRAQLDLEVDRLWRRTWQPVCHRDQLAKVGDSVVYQVAGLSAVVVRAREGDGGFKAYENSCPHRGAQLRDCAGTLAQIRCPFHGFSWNLDGSFKGMPCEWDFPHDQSSFRLTELQVDEWCGFVFINPDPSAPSLREHLGEEVTKHFERWGAERRVPVFRVTQPIAANWKVAIEAFLETLHISGIHSQALMEVNDTNAQYDIFPPHTTRMAVARNIPSRLLGELDPDEVGQEILDHVVEAKWHGVFDGKQKLDPTAMLPAEVLARLDPEIRDEPFTLREGWTARSMLAELSRAQVRAASGDEIPPEFLSDAEVNDALHYTVFPSFSIMGGYAFGHVWWFRPVDPADPESCVMEFYVLRPAMNGEVGAAAPMREIKLEQDDLWVEKIPELGALSLLNDQDYEMMARQQRGLRTASQTGHLLRYTERRIQYFHDVLEGYIGDAGMADEAGPA